MRKSHKHCDILGPFAPHWQRPQACLIFMTGDSVVRHSDGPRIQPPRGRPHPRRLRIFLHHRKSRGEDNAKARAAASASGNCWPGRPPRPFKLRPRYNGKFLRTIFWLRNLKIGASCLMGQCHKNYFDVPTVSRKFDDRLEMLNEFCGNW